MARSTLGDSFNVLDAIVPNFRFLGASFWIAWQLVFFGCEINFCGFSLGETDVALVYVTLNISFAACLGVIGIAHYRVFRLLNRPRFVIAMGILASLGTALTFLLQYFGGYWYLLGAIICGIGTSFLASHSISQFAELGPREIIFMSAMVQVVAFTIDYTVLSIATIVQPWLFFFLPLLCALCLLVESADRIASASSEGWETPGWFWRFAVGIFFFAIPVSICRARFPVFGNENAVLVDYRRLTGAFTMALMLVIAFTTLRLPKNAHFGLIMYRMILIFSILYVLFGAVGPQNGFVLSMSGVINALISLCVWCLLASISFKSGASTFQVFAFGYGSFTLGGIAGWGLGLMAEHQGLSLDTVIVCLVASAVIALIVALFLFRQEDLERMMQPVEEDYDPGDPFSSVESEKKGELLSAAPTNSWAYARLMLTEQGQLSARELDVLDLIARGYSARVVSDELCISYNTTRNHIQRIYTKLDIHSRNELHTLIRSFIEKE